MIATEQVIKAPNKYDLAFLEWYRRHGAQIYSYFSSIDVWSHDGDGCPFKVTQGMIDRLEHARLIEERFPTNGGLWSRYWGIKR